LATIGRKALFSNPGADASSSFACSAEKEWTLFVMEGAISELHPERKLI